MEAAPAASALPPLSNVSPLVSALLRQQPPPAVSADALPGLLSLLGLLEASEASASSDEAASDALAEASAPQPLRLISGVGKRAGFWDKRSLTLTDSQGPRPAAGDSQAAGGSLAAGDSGAFRVSGVSRSETAPKRQSLAEYPEWLMDEV